MLCVHVCRSVCGCVCVILTGCYPVALPFWPLCSSIGDRISAFASYLLVPLSREAFCQRWQIHHILENWEVSVTVQVWKTKQRILLAQKRFARILPVSMLFRHGADSSTSRCWLPHCSIWNSTLYLSMQATSNHNPLFYSYTLSAPM